MDARDLRRWHAARVTAHDREREERRGRPVSAQDSFERALALIEAVGRAQGWPARTTPEEAHEDQQVRRTWARLRAAIHGTEAS